jgi:energy-converting hydrogenase A subunit B
MLEEYGQIVLAAAITWILFVSLDIFWRLPEKGSVSGADAIGSAISRRGGDQHGGWMMGNIVSSPDASAGTLLAACGIFVAGIPGGIAAAALVYVGNKICHDSGYAGTSGALIATFVIAGCMQIGFPASDFIAGMVLAILTIQGISHAHASRLIGYIWRWRA